MACRRFTRSAALLDNAAEDIWPTGMCRSNTSAAPTARNPSVNKEIKRGSTVVGSFPKSGGGIAVVRPVLLEQYDG
jgi:hypothetical protein